MAWVATAIIGAGALGAGASIYGANKAADAQTSATNAATTAQRQQFDISKGESQPFIDAGTGAIPTLQNFTDPNNANSPLAALMKLTMPGANMTDTLSQTPGYQFTEDKGLRAVNNALAARGLGGSGGAVAKGAADYTTGLANNTWQSVVNALLGTYNAGVTPLQNLVSTGAGSASSLTGASTATGQQIGSNIIGAGNAQAGAATATGSAIGNLGNSISTAALLNKLIGTGGTSAATAGSGGLYGVGSGATAFANGASAFG